MILFTIVTSIDDKSCFGDNTQLFEAINSEVFKDKLSETIKGMESLFGKQNVDGKCDENSFNFNSDENPFNSENQDSPDMKK